MIIVPDTNVIISAQINSLGNEAQILTAWGKGEIDFALTWQMLDEYKRALSYEKVQKYLGWSSETIAGTVQDLALGAGKLFPGTTQVDVSQDPHDNMLFACAIEAQADYIVSGDKKHVLSVGSFRGTLTISPHEFVEQVLEVKQAA